MKYTATIYKTISEEIFIEANTPAEAIKSAKEKYTGFTVDTVNEVTGEDEDNNPIYGEEFTVSSFCESCGKDIMSGEEYYAWQDIDTCKECGGATDTHPKSIA